MKVSTFWIIALKLIGIFLVLQSFTVVPQFISVVASMFTMTNQDDSVFITILIVGLSFVLVGTYILILRLVVFKTNWLIEKLKLLRGFEEERIDFNIQLSTTIRIAVIVIGGIMMAESLPQLCKDIFVFFQEKAIFRDSQIMNWIIFDAFRSVIAYFLISNSKVVATFISRNSDNTENSLKR